MRVTKRDMSTAADLVMLTFIIMFVVTCAHRLQTMREWACGTAKDVANVVEEKLAQVAKPCLDVVKAAPQAVSDLQPNYTQLAHLKKLFDLPMTEATQIMQAVFDTIETHMGDMMDNLNGLPS